MEFEAFLVHLLGTVSVHSSIGRTCETYHSKWGLSSRAPIIKRGTPLGLDIFTKRKHYFKNCNLTKSNVNWKKKSQSVTETDQCYKRFQ